MANSTDALITEYIDSWALSYLKDKMEATNEELTYLVKLAQLREEMLKQKIDYDYDNPSVVVDNFLYHGDIWHAGNIDLLTKLGVQHIINVSGSVLKTEITMKFNVLWICIDDSHDVSISRYFQQTNDFLFSCKEKNEKVLVNCEMGISRSSSIVLAYLMKYHHDTLMKAYKYLLEQRPICAPNFGFLLQLIRYEKLLRNSGIIDEQQNDDDKQNPIKPIDTSI